MRGLAQLADIQLRDCTVRSTFRRRLHGHCCHTYSQTPSLLILVLSLPSASLVPMAELTLFSNLFSFSLEDLGSVRCLVQRQSYFSLDTLRISRHLCHSLVRLGLFCLSSSFERILKRCYKWCQHWQQQEEREKHSPIVERWDMDPIYRERLRFEGRTRRDCKYWDHISTKQDKSKDLQYQRTQKEKHVGAAGGSKTSAKGRAVEVQMNTEIPSVSTIAAVTGFFVC